MRDYISINRVANLHPKVRAKYTQAIELAETKFPKTVAIRVVQGLRTIEEQNGLYALGRTKVNPDGRTNKKPMGNIVTKAVGGKSYHNYGLSIDFALLYDTDGNGTYETLSWDLVKDFDRDGEADWMEVVKVFKSLGFEWGGDWTSIKDNPHFQMTFGYSVSQLMAFYNDKTKRIPGTPYVNI